MIGSGQRPSLLLTAVVCFGLALAVLAVVPSPLTATTYYHDVRAVDAVPADETAVAYSSLPEVGQDVVASGSDTEETVGTDEAVPEFTYANDYEPRNYVSWGDRAYVVTGSTTSQYAAAERQLLVGGFGVLILLLSIPNLLDQLRPPPPRERPPGERPPPSDRPE